MMVKTATAYQKSDVIYVHSDSKSTAGLMVASPPYLKVEAKEPLSARGEAVLAALHASQEAVPHPRQGDWHLIFLPILQLARAQSLEEFEKDAVLCSLEAETPEVLRLTPHRKRGRDKGYIPLEREAITVPMTASPAEIGAALEEAFRRCPTFPPKS